MANSLLRQLDSTYGIPNDMENIREFQEREVELIVPMKSYNKTKSIRGYKRKARVIMSQRYIYFYTVYKKGSFLCNNGKSKLFFVVPIENLKLQTLKTDHKLIITQDHSKCVELNINKFQYPSNVLNKFLLQEEKTVKLILCFKTDIHFSTVCKDVEVKLEELTKLSKEADIEEDIVQEPQESIFDKLTSWYSVDKSKDTTNTRSDFHLIKTDESDSAVKENKYIHAVKVLDEILTSEKDYVLDLCTIVNDFLQPLTSYFISNEHISASLKDIFNNIGSILEVNAELLKAITDKLNKLQIQEDTPSLEEVLEVYSTEFLRHMDYFKMYSLYCHEYKSNLDKLNELKENSKEFNSKLETAELKTKQTLQSLLIKPVQRICKYPLLFQELYKVLKDIEIEWNRKDDKLYKKVIYKIKETYENIEKITNTVNSRVQDIENQQFVVQVYLELGGEKEKQNIDIMLPTRRFKSCYEVLVYEHHASKSSSSSSSSKQMKRIPCVVYLFNDFLIIGKLIQSLLGRKLISSSSTSQNTNQKYLSSSTRSMRNNTSSNSSKNLKQRAKTLYKFNFNTQRVRVRKSTNDILYDKQRRCPFQLVVTESNLNDENKRMESSILKFDIWCENKQIRDNFAMEIAENIHQTQKKAQLRNLTKFDRRICAKDLRKSSSESCSPSPVLSLREKRVQQTNKVTFSEPRGREPLSRIAEKYEKQKKMYSVTFGEGLLGLSLKNATIQGMKLGPEESKRDLDYESDAERTSGVVVAVVTGNSQAELKGVRPGDRILQINSTTVRDTATWKQVFDLIKEKERPITLKFMRNVSLTTNTSSTLQLS